VISQEEKAEVNETFSSGFQYSIKGDIIVEE